MERLPKHAVMASHPAYTMQINASVGSSTAAANRECAGAATGVSRSRVIMGIGEFERPGILGIDLVSIGPQTPQRGLQWENQFTQRG